ncbi:MAG: type II toxin-antitoxin system VapB family antitoxin [Acidobacteriota bacterium]
MIVTLEIDDELLAEARALCGFDDVESIVREALRALIQREAARRLRD